MTKTIKQNNDFLYIKDSSIQKVLVKNIKNKTLIIINNLNNTQESNIEFILEKNARIDILEVFLNKTQVQGSAKRIMTLDNKAKLNYCKLQVLEEDSTLSCTFNSDLEKECELSMHLIEKGSKDSINTINNDLKKKNIKLKINILTKLLHKSKVQNHIKTIHNAQNTYSCINNKHILDNESSSLFAPLSIVNKKALYAGAYQYSKAILLSDDCNIKANPHLEILIDELKAGHGSSIGSIDENALYYLQSRGIKKETAKHMILQAFENDIYDNIDAKNIQDFIKDFSRKAYV